jgi:hypothetical protein
MGLCYSPDGKGGVQWPVDEDSGVLKEETFLKWKKYDPVTFLEDRVSNVQKLHGLRIECGNRDQFHLQYGTRQIHNLLVRHRINHDYSEFDGNHFDIDQCRPRAWRWLSELWNSKFPTKP